MNIRPILFIGCFGLLLYANSLGGEFVWDDAGFVVDNASIRTFENLIRFFTDPSTAAQGGLSKDVYRPITAFSYALDYFFWKLNSFGYHLSNIILHAINGILVYMLLSLITRDPFLALFASLLFVSHPVQTEAVAWISGRSSVLFLFFYLSSLIFYIRFSNESKRIYHIVSILFFLFSLFSKEMSVTLPLILIVYDIHFSKKQNMRRRIRKYAPYFALTFFYVMTRTTLLKQIGQFEGWAAPYSTFLTMSKIVVDYIKILIFPLKLCAVGYIVPISDSIVEPQVIFSLSVLFAVVLGVPFIFRHFRLASFSLWWFFITLLPVLNIIPIKALEAERFLYLPSIGFCILAASIASNRRNRRFDRPIVARTTITPFVLSALILAYSIRTVVRNEDWKSEIRISEQTVKASPHSAWAFTALGANYIERENYEEAMKYLKTAVGLSNEYELARNALGICYLKLGSYEEAILEFVEVIKLNPYAVSSRNMLGVAYANIKRYDDAEKQFLIAIKREERFSNAYLNLARLYEMKGEETKAMRRYFDIILHTQSPQDIAIAYIRIGDLYARMNFKDKAKAYYEKAANTCGSALEGLRKVAIDKIKSL